ncbi:Mg(2+) transport ATPase protein C [Brachybacterium faecium]|uniref:Uncharacterized membrane protein n=1 Tax=Brachybacterium faecium (strain ATCC 43885 / DSM 4810 / JCM 11609 / LMG 19847 / NBRC 14762 / NCIMB 9860 / 6-10) TaxID=446465 RepID=C7MHQ5_BRAFD|nr:MgtC/SapB family protein [Brachybacterium faecium]ACU86572.1 uncharacterized membrane protein [Brachybacterium faecium DSM 4810]SLM92390.1 Mg(2+) transport ATPase protein C [Brachybacterium faecium]
MDAFVGLLHDSSLVEAQLLLITFVLCSLIGLERQIRQKSAGFRTHVLVGLGSCAFTLVSAYGFSAVLADEVMLDPSRIAAQIVSGIGFLGAGVIFKGHNVVRGLTTAATIWVAAAVGMTMGAGMISLAALLTFLHLLTLFAVAPLVRMLPSQDRYRTLRVRYADGAGVLRDLLSKATTMGFSSSVIKSRRIECEGGDDSVEVDVQFHGRTPLRDLLPEFMDIQGVERVSLRVDDDQNGNDSDEI